MLCLWTLPVNGQNTNSENKQRNTCCDDDDHHDNRLCNIIDNIYLKV